MHFGLPDEKTVWAAAWPFVGGATSKLMTSAAMAKKPGFRHPKTWEVMCQSGRQQGPERKVGAGAEDRTRRRGIGINGGPATAPDRFLYSSNNSGNQKSSSAASFRTCKLQEVLGMKRSPARRLRPALLRSGPYLHSPLLLLLFSVVVAVVMPTVRGACYTKPDARAVCGDLADACDTVFCETCDHVGECDTTCGVCSISTTVSTTTPTTTTSVTTSTTTTTCYSKNLQTDDWCAQVADMCDLLLCHESRCGRAGQCDSTCGYCSTTTTTTTSTTSSTTTTTTTRTTSSTQTTTTITTTATTVTSTTTISTTTSLTSTRTSITETLTTTTATATTTTNTRTTITATASTITATASTNTATTTSTKMSGLSDDSTTYQDGSAATTTGELITTTADMPDGTTSPDEPDSGATTASPESLTTGTGTTATTTMTSAKDDGENATQVSTTLPATCQIRGSFTLVLNGSVTTEEFCANTDALLAVQAVLAEVGGLEPAAVSLSCAASAARRRLIEANLRVLSVAVDISYAIQAATQAGLLNLEKMDESSLETLLVDRFAASDLDLLIAYVTGLAVEVVPDETTTTATKTTTTTTTKVMTTSANVPPSLAQQAEDLVTTGAGVGWFIVPILIAVFCIVCWGSYCLVCGRRGMMPTLPRTPSQMSKASAASSRHPTSGISSEEYKVTEGGSTFPIPTSNSRGGISPYRGEDNHYSSRPNRAFDETSESTLATSASACWRANMASRKLPVANDANDRSSRAVERTREFDPLRQGQGLSPNLYLGRYFGRWTRRGSPDFGAEIRGDTIRFNNGVEKNVNLAEDGSLEVEALNGEICRGRLVGEELLWDDGDMWSRSRSPDANWLNNGYGRSFNETQGSHLLGEDNAGRSGGFGCCDPPPVPQEGRYGDQGDPYGEGDMDLFDLLPCGGEAPNSNPRQRASERCLFSC